jgi:hypothetical protein
MQAQAQAQAQTQRGRHARTLIDNRDPLPLDEASEDVYGGGSGLWDLPTELRGDQHSACISRPGAGGRLSGCAQGIDDESGGNEAIHPRASLPRLYVGSVDSRRIGNGGRRLSSTVMCGCGHGLVSSS